MQHIRDNEFDQLFKNKFEGAEIQPTAGLWGNVAAGLKPIPKRKLPIYWMAAAVAILVVAAGLLLPETETIRLQGRAKVETVPLTVVEGPKSVTTSATDEKVYTSTPLVLPPRLNAEPEELPDLKPVPVKQENEHLAHISVVKEMVYPPKDEEPVQDGPVLANHNVKNDMEEDIGAAKSEEATNKGIRNVGDLINFVVNKIDKREKKLIQFETDDDNSSIIALNIGFIKLNRKSDK